MKMEMGRRVAPFQPPLPLPDASMCIDWTILGIQRHAVSRCFYLFIVASCLVPTPDTSPPISSGIVRRLFRYFRLSLAHWKIFASFDCHILLGRLTRNCYKFSKIIYYIINRKRIVKVDKDS